MISELLILSPTIQKEWVVW